MINLTRETLWLSAQEACEALAIKKATLYAYVSRGKVRAQPVGGGRGRQYLREDIERLLASRGRKRIASSQGPITETKLTTMSGLHPAYRGRSALALELDSAWTFEHTCEWLWSDTTDAASVESTEDWPRVTDAWSVNPNPPTDVISAMVGAVMQGAASPCRYEAGRHGDLRMSRHLMRLALAGSNLARDASAGEWALAQPTLAQGFLAAFGAKSDPVRVAAVDGALTLLADRGLDSAAAATRAAAGGGAEVHLSLGAGLCALTIEGLSPHLATEQRASLLDAIELPERAATEIRARMARRERIHGFCGPDDPVVRRLLALARELAPQKQPLRVLRALIDTADVAGLPAPGMGWGLLALAIALEVGRDGAIALLALGRSAGLIAHALEQRDLGPLGVRARYVGAPMHTTDGLP